MLKPHWHCREFGEDGFVFVAVDQMMGDGTLVGLRHAVHPFMLDEDASLFWRIIEKLTVMLDQTQYPLLQIDESGEVSRIRPHDISRACAFGG